MNKKTMSIPSCFSQRGKFDLLYSEDFEKLRNLLRKNQRIKGKYPQYFAVKKSRNFSAETRGRRLPARRQFPLGRLRTLAYPQ